MTGPRVWTSPKDVAVETKRARLDATGWVPETLDGKRWFGPVPRDRQPRIGLHLDLAWLFQNLADEHDAPICWDELTSVYDPLGGPWLSARDTHKATGWKWGTVVRRGNDVSVGRVVRWHATRVAVAWGDINGPVAWYDTDALVEVEAR